jgi:hypothetical protein
MSRAERVHFTLGEVALSFYPAIFMILDTQCLLAAIAIVFSNSMCAPRCINFS